MQLSKKSRYGFRALIDLSISDKKYMSLSSIAERNEIPLQFLEQVFGTLRRGGLVVGLKGSQGGYKLSRAPKKITAAEILEVLDGPYLIDREEVSLDSSCRGIAESVQSLLIDKLNQQLDYVLKNLTLADMAERCLANEKDNQHMYYI